MTLPLVAILGRARPVDDLSFLSGAMPPGAVFSRSASSATDLTPYSTSGYSTYSTDQPRVTSKGLLLTSAYTCRSLNSFAPANHTTGATGAGAFTFWVAGSGSATIAAGTAVGTGWGTATAGNPISLNITSSGTTNITVSGSLTTVQLQTLDFPGPAIQTAGAAVSTTADLCYYPRVINGPFTMVVEFIPLTMLTTRVRSILTLAQNSTNFIGLRFPGSQAGPTWTFNPGTGTATGTPTSVAAGGQIVRAGLAFDGSSGLVMCSDGAPQVVTPMSLPPGITALVLGDRDPVSSGASGFLYIRRAKLWDRNIGGTQLQAEINAIGN